MQFSKLTKALIGLTALTLGVCGGWALYKRMTCPPITVYAWRLPSGPVFLAEDPENPTLKAYAKQEHLDEVVRPYKTDMEKLFALCKWASKTFPPTNPFPNYPPWDAPTILDWIRKGKTGGFCGQYAFVFGQAAQSLGYFPRYFDVASPENNGGHFTIAVYVPSLKKWVIFEPTWGTYYVNEAGQPLGMLELHEYAIGKRQGKVLEYPSMKQITRERLHLFYYFRYYLRNNFVSVPVFARRAQGTWWFEQYRLAWIDEYTESQPHKSQAIPSSNPADFVYQFDVSKPKREIWCKRRMDFVKALSEAPPLELVKVHIPHCSLTRLVKFVFVNNPDYHRLTPASALQL